MTREELDLIPISDIRFLCVSCAECAAEILIPLTKEHAGLRARRKCPLCGSVLWLGHDDMELARLLVEAANDEKTTMRIAVPAPSRR